MAEGLIVRKGGSSSEVVTSLSLVSSASSSTNVTIPSSVIAGDLIVIYSFEAAGVLNTTNFSTISDFAFFARELDSSDTEGAIYYKISNGTESGRVVAGVNSAITTAVAVFRGNVPIKMAMPVITNSQATISTPTNQTVNLNGFEGPLIAFAFYGGTTTINETTNITLNQITTNDPDTKFAYKIYNKTDSMESFIVSMPDEGDNFMASGAILLR